MDRSAIFVDDATITVPFCGSFTYKVQSTDVENDEGKKRYKYSMALAKTEDSLLCKGDDWTLDMTIFDGAFDAASQADFKLITNSDLPPRFLHAWNIQRTDPQSEGTPGIGQVAVFKVAEARKALAVAASRNYDWYIQDKEEPFDAARFASKVKNTAKTIIRMNRTMQVSVTS